MMMYEYVWCLCLNLHSIHGNHGTQYETHGINGSPVTSSSIHGMGHTSKHHEWMSSTSRVLGRTGDMQKSIRCVSILNIDIRFDIRMTFGWFRMPWMPFWSFWGPTKSDEHQHVRSKFEAQSADCFVSPERWSGSRIRWGTSDKWKLWLWKLFINIH